MKKNIARMMLLALVAQGLSACVFNPDAQNNPFRNGSMYESGGVPSEENVRVLSSGELIHQ